MHETTLTRENGQYVIRCVCGWSRATGTRKTAIRWGEEHAGGLVRVAQKPRRARNARRMAFEPVRAARVAAPVADRFVVGKHSGWTKQDWLNRVKTQNLEELGRGAGRTVWALDAKRVIKIDTGGWEQCNSESLRWIRADAQTRTLLGEIYESGDGWIIMERARGVIRQFGDLVTTTVSRDLRKATGFNDLHGNNIGYFGNGIFKILDYAL